MKRIALFLPLLAVPFLGACISLKTGSNDPLRAPSPEAGAVEATLIVEPTQETGETQPAAEQEDAYANEWTVEQLALWRSPRFQEAFMQSFLAETDIEPKVTTVEIQDLQKVQALIAEEKTTEAVKILEKNRAGSGSAVWDQMLGNIYFQREEWDQAMWAYQSAVEKFPKFRRAWKNLGVVLIRREEFAEAAEAFSKVVALGGGDGITYGLLGFAYSRLDDFIAAESAYRMAVLLDPKTGEWKTGLVTAFFKQQRYADAAAMCGTMIAKSPARADLWLLQGNAWLGLGKPMEAAQNFEFVDTLGKSTPESLNILGDIYVNESYYDQAASAYARALEASGEKGVAKALRNAKVLVSRNANEEAGSLLEGLEDLGLQEFDAAQRKELLQLKARLAVATGATEQHVAILLEIVEQDPLDGGALILLGDHFASHEDPDRATVYYERAAGINEEYEATATDRQGRMLARMGEYQDALRLLRRSLELQENERLRAYVESIAKIVGR